jgi:hypothetical protein
MKVTFKNLGHANKTFTTEIKELCYDELYRVAKPYIISREIDFYYDAENKKGKVVVGIVRNVGEFEVEDN